MKCILYVLVPLLLANTNLQAQKFKAGFTLGLDATDIDGADRIDDDNDFHKLGFTVGGILSTSLTAKSTFQFELNFIQKGSSQSPDSANNGFYRISLSYVELPLLIKRRLKFNMGKKQVTRFELEGGLSIARLVTTRVTGSNNYTLPSDNLFNRTDLSLLAGIDYTISKNIYFCLRYSNSVIPAIKRNTPNFQFITYTFNRGNNMVFQFSFKFLFGSVPQSGDRSASSKEDQN